MRYEVRKFDDRTPPLVVKSDDPDHAPDEAARHVEWTETGQVVFLEVRPEGSDDEWALWRVECISLSPLLGFYTARSTAEEARAEIA